MSRGAGLFPATPTAQESQTPTEALVSQNAISQRGAVQRLLIAIAVVLAPVCSNLPCCCERAAASEASCCKKSETAASCCQGKSPKDTRAAGSCCDQRHRSPEESPANSFKLPSCECCVQTTAPEPVITAVPRSAAKSKDSSLIAAIQSKPSETFASLQITAGKNSPEVSPGKHNRQQAMLCVWRN
jgi:hypothetical protein